MKAWHAALAALALLVPQASTAADDLVGAARDLARKTVAWNAGPVAVTYRNLSSLPDSDLVAVRREFDAVFSPPGAGASAVEARVTLSARSASSTTIAAGPSPRSWSGRT